MKDEKSNLESQKSKTSVLIKTEQFGELKKNDLIAYFPCDLGMKWIYEIKREEVEPLKYQIINYSLNKENFCTIIRGFFPRTLLYPLFVFKDEVHKSLFPETLFLLLYVLENIKGKELC